jgi:hypothetical protein
MASLMFSPVADKIESGTYLLYDCACGTGGMLTVAEETLQQIAAMSASRKPGRVMSELSVRIGSWVLSRPRAWCRNGDGARPEPCAIPTRLPNRLCR